MKQTKSKIIQTLTTAALALPGIQLAHAESPPSYTHVELGYSNYSESANRYKIDVYQGLIQVPHNNWLFQIGTERDLQTGASFVFPDLHTGASVLTNTRNSTILFPIYTGASISEAREQFNFTGSYYFPTAIASLGVGYSTENDYLSKSITGEWRKLFRKKATELSFEFNYADDQLRPKRDATPQHTVLTISSANKNSVNLVLGLRQDFSIKTTGKISVSYFREHGYLADPYKRVVIYGDALDVRPGSDFMDDAIAIYGPYQIELVDGYSVDYDRRPSLREAGAAEAMIMHYIEKTNGSGQLKYGYAYDSWGVHSHALEAAYFQPLHKFWLISPLARYYFQSEAKFYSYAFQVAPGAPFPAKPLPIALQNSSDNRLSKFGTLNLELTLTRTFFNNISLSFTGGVFTSNEKLYIGHTPYVSNPFNDYTSTYFSMNTGIDFA